jgi:hypothetical protein
MRTTLNPTGRRHALCGFYAALFAVGAATLSPSVAPFRPFDRVAWAVCALLWVVVAISPGRRRRLWLIGLIGVAFALRVGNLFEADTVTNGNAVVASTVYLGYAIALSYIVVVWRPIRED